MTGQSFDDVPEAAIEDALNAHPLAWIACEGEAFLAAAPTLWRSPFLIGHVPRAWPIAQRFNEGCKATFLFFGPNGYMSPSWLSRREWGPTWNFVSVQFRGQVVLRDERAYLGEHLDDLCATMEAHRSGWTPAALGERLEMLASRIVAFSVTPTSRQVRFKLGQDESDQVLAELLHGLESEPGGAPLRAWMKRLNAWRDKG
jgi:transcriptional regulator